MSDTEIKALADVVIGRLLDELSGWAVDEDLPPRVQERAARVAREDAVRFYRQFLQKKEG